jgi:hypothetical protein
VRRLSLCLVLAGLAPALAGIALAREAPTEVLRGVDTGLCPFPLEVTVTRRVRRSAAVEVVGPSTIVVRNRATGRSATLLAAGTSTLHRATGRLTYSGRQLWLSADAHVPYLATDGASARPRTIDPCALVSNPPPAAPLETRAPWPLPAYVLTRIASAGLTPVVGRLVRHDHVHLDLIVDARRITVPAGVGHAEPFDAGAGRCPPPPESLGIGDCASGHFFTAKVALSPLHPHTTSGIVHIESDRHATFTLGQFFDEWGVRFDAECLGAYCSTGGKQLRVYVNGKRLAGDPRRLVLLDRQEIAVVVGRAGGAVPSRFTKRMPIGGGGPGERPCPAVR